MVQRLICCLSCLSLSVTVATGSDQPSDVAPPAPPTVTPQPVPSAPARLPQTDGDASLSPIEHLRRAADHLDAADIGDLSIDMHTEAKQLRERADQLEQGATKELAELRKQLDDIQEEIRRIEQLTASHDRIQLDIKVVEVDMTKLRQLGFNMEALKPSGGGIITQASAASNGAIQIEVVSGDGPTKFLEALESEGLVKILAEPRIVTTSGHEASIHSGGEFAVPIPQENGTVSIEWREYGTRVYALPVILNNGRLKLTVIPEIKERDFSRAVMFEGMKVPGLTARRVNTEVEMDFGQTFVISGLISTTTSPPEKQAVRVPGRDRLFRQVDLPRKVIKKQLVVLVTPSRYEPAQD